jgi:hypothetical protein
MVSNTIINEWHNFAEVPKLILDQVIGGNMFELSKNAAVSWLMILIAILAMSNLLSKYLNKPEYIFKNPVYIGVIVGLVYAAHQLYTITTTYSKLLNWKMYLGIFLGVAIALVLPMVAMYYYSNDPDKKKWAIGLGYLYSAVFDFIVLWAIQLYASNQSFVVKQAISSSTFLLLPLFQITRTWRTSMQLAALNELA